jgi:hypothetical protein
MAALNVLTREAMVTVLQNARDVQAALPLVPQGAQSALLESLRNDVVMFVEMFRPGPARRFGMTEKDVSAVVDVQTKLAYYTARGLVPTTKAGDVMPTPRQLMMLARIMAAHHKRVDEAEVAKARETAKREAERVTTPRFQPVGTPVAPAPSPARPKAPTNLPLGAQVIYPEPVVVMPGYTYQAPAVRRARRYFRKPR